MSKMVKVQQFDLESTDLKIRPPWAPSLALSIVSCVSLSVFDILEHQLCTGDPAEVTPFNSHSTTDGSGNIPILQ